MGVFAEHAPSDFVVPDIIHPSIRDHYQSIVQFIWNELETFIDANGKSRVFFSSPITSADQSESGSMEINLFPNPNQGQFWITKNFHFSKTQVMNAQGVVLKSFNSHETAPVFVDLSAQPDGVYYVIFKSNKSAQSEIKSFVKIAR